MADQINTAFVRQFSDNFKLTAQQLTTEIRSKVTVETNIKDKKYIDYIGETPEPVMQGALVQKKVFAEIPHTRRMIFTRNWNQAVPVPRAAVNRMLLDPTNDYMMSLKGAFERLLERRMFLAAIGSAITVGTEDLTESTVSLPSTQKYTESGTVGMTASKIKRASTRFWINNRGKVEKCLALAPLSIENLMDDVDVLRVEQEALKLLYNGAEAFTNLWGFKVMMSSELPLSGSIRSNIAWCKQGLGIGFNDDYHGDINKRPEYIELYDIEGNMDFGCARLAETDVFEIQAYESYT